MAANINRVVLVGNLTKDPELRHTPSGTAVCSLRLAVNTRRKDSATGEWTEKPNYFDITVWGNQGESCAQYLAKGRPVAVDGRLEWREWDAQDGTKRQAVEIIADSVQFLGSRRGGPSAGPIRKKNCWFCRNKIVEVDWKDANQLRRYVSEKGKIRSRRITGACRRHQRQVAVAVKRAREMALLPYVAEGREERPDGRRDRGDRGDHDRER